MIPGLIAKRVLKRNAFYERADESSDGLVKDARKLTWKMASRALSSPGKLNP
jgi:hypothetical protein